MKRPSFVKLISWLVIVSAFMLLDRGTDTLLNEFRGDSWLWWVLFGMVAIITLVQLIGTFQALSNVGGSKSRRPQDVTAENHPPTSKATPLIQELTNMGFTRLGETLTKVVMTAKAVTWILVSPDKTVTVEVVDIGHGMPAMLQFSTIFLDEAALETSYPIGENQNFPMFRANYNTTSAAAAYQQHLDTRAAMQAEHGAPRPFSNMPQYLEWDIRYRELHIHKRLGGAVVPSVAMSLWFLVLTGLMAFIAVTEANPDLFSRNTQLVVMITATTFLLLGGLTVLALGRTNMKIASDVARAKSMSAKPKP